MLRDSFLNGITEYLAGVGKLGPVVPVPTTQQVRMRFTLHEGPTSNDGRATARPVIPNLGNGPIGRRSFDTWKCCRFGPCSI